VLKLARKGPPANFDVCMELEIAPSWNSRPIRIAWSGSAK